MFSKNIIKTSWQSAIATVLILSFLTVVQAEVRSSTNYKLQSDSINFGGGLATSSNYSLESTAGEIASGLSTSTSYSLKAGYQQMNEIFISITSASSVAMFPNIGGLTGGTSNGSTTVIVTTDSPSGYQLTIKADSSPAMQKGVDIISDYVPLADPSADMSFVVDSTDVHFGFSPESDDLVQKWRDNSTVCGLGNNNTPLTCWDGLSTSDQILSQGSTNQPNGATTTINFRVGLGSSVNVVPGDYVATSTLTALPL